MKEPMLEVRMGWHDAAAAALRRVGGGTWDARRRAWLFPLSSHDRVVEALRGATGVKIKVEPLHPLPAAVLKVRTKRGMSGKAVVGACPCFRNFSQGVFSLFFSLLFVNTAFSWLLSGGEYYSG